MNVLYANMEGIYFYRNKEIIYKYTYKKNDPVTVIKDKVIKVFNYLADNNLNKENILVKSYLDGFKSKACLSTVIQDYINKINVIKLYSYNYWYEKLEDKSELLKAYKEA